MPSFDVCNTVMRKRSAKRSEIDMLQRSKHLQNENRDMSYRRLLGIDGPHCSWRKSNVWKLAKSLSKGPMRSLKALVVNCALISSQRSKRSPLGLSRSEFGVTSSRVFVSRTETSIESTSGFIRSIGESGSSSRMAMLLRTHNRRIAIGFVVKSLKQRGLLSFLRRRISIQPRKMSPFLQV